MALALNEEQRLLRSTAREFLDATAPVAALRRLRDSRDPVGYDADLWRQMVELGWPGIALPEQHGGLGFGFTGLGVVMEEAGRSLTASPLFASVVVGASALALGGSEAQRSTLLPAVARRLIGRVGPETEPARAMLERLGFQYKGHVAHRWRE